MPVCIVLLTWEDRFFVDLIVTKTSQMIYPNKINDAAFHSKLHPI